jgi:glycoside/pentoside/hexuronide:cation symporter, GPH family
MTPRISPSSESGDASPRPEASISFRIKAIFSIGGGIQQFVNAAPVYLANPIFNLALGLNPVIIGFVLATGRLWDAIIGPLVGHFSDNAQTRWGRRRPFMAVGAILMGLSFAAMWWLPRNEGHSFYFGYFLLTLLLFYLGEVLYTVPWAALGIEMTDSYNERTALFAGAGVTQNLATILAGWLYPLAQLAVFQDVLQGMRVVGCVCGTLIILITLIPPLLLKEPKRRTAIVARKPEPFWAAIKVVLSNAVLRRFSLACLITMMSLTTVSSLGLYINIYYIYHGDKVAAATMMGIWGTLFNIVGLCSIPGILWLARRIGKHHAMMVGLGMVAVSAVLKLVIFDPAHPYLQLTGALLHAPGYATYVVLVNSMTADIVDYDASISGRRREALIAAANGWITKMGISSSFILAGLVLSVTGFNAALGGNQAPGTVLGMRALFTAIPACGCLVALLLLRGYPLTRERMDKIRVEREALLVP